MTSERKIGTTTEERGGGTGQQGALDIPIQQEEKRERESQGRAIPRGGPLNNREMGKFNQQCRGILILLFEEEERQTDRSCGFACV